MLPVAISVNKNEIPIYEITDGISAIERPTLTYEKYMPSMNIATANTMK